MSEQNNNLNKIVGFLPELSQKIPTDDTKFLFFFPAEIGGDKILFGLTFKTGVQIFSIFTLLLAINSFLDIFSPKSFWLFLVAILAFCVYGVIASYAFLSTLSDNYNFARVSYLMIAVLFLLMTLRFLGKSIVKIVDFITPWDGDFLKLDFLIYIFGYGFYLFVYLYFIYILYRYMIQIKGNSSNNNQNNELVNSFLKEMYLNNPILIILAILAIICALFGNKIIGYAGEFWVRMELKKLPKEYLIINDLLLKYNNKTCQIDHLVISKYGIFVIETKQYNGYIKGNDFDKNWEQIFNKKIYYLHNPIHQNYGHVQVLKEILNLEESIFIPLVCISSRAKVNVKSKKVVLLKDLLDTILKYRDEQIIYYKEIYDYINAVNIREKKEKKKHVVETKKIVNQKKKENINKCPKCGGILVERTSKYGKFTGCSNYPKCKYIKRY